MGFTYCKAQDNFIMNQTYIDHKAEMSGRVLMPTPQ